MNGCYGPQITQYAGGMEIYSAIDSQNMIVHIERLGRRLLRCGVCRQRCRKVHSVRKPREWRDLSMRKLPLKLRYRPRRVLCPRCGLRVEDFPWADPWARVTTALSNAVARLARELSWQGTARQEFRAVSVLASSDVRPVSEPVGHVGYAVLVLDPIIDL